MEMAPIGNATSISYNSREIMDNTYVVIWKFSRGPVGRSLPGFVGFCRIMESTENHQMGIRLPVRDNLRVLRLLRGSWHYRGSRIAA